MAKPSWAKCPYADLAYAYPGPALKKAWARLHVGDREPFPTQSDLQEAWRRYHAGNFQAAVEQGCAFGGAGLNPAIKAQVIYATYLEKAQAKKLKLFQEAMEWGEQAMEERPDDHNAQYFYALAAGRYSQLISVAKALAQGLGTKVKRALDTALELQPKHADANIALGAWHAEVIGKVGAMVGKLTYGASREAAAKHYQQAIKLNPDSAIARMEYANGLVLMYGEQRMKEAEKLYAEAAQQQPMDAMERLDVELAKEELAG
jgi:tetratricopeptide (TPR) repeat protein